MPRDLGTRLLVGLATAQVGLALPGALFQQPPYPLVPAWVRFLLLLSFGAGATWLLLAGQADMRARTLGTIFLLVASAFSLPFLAVLARNSAEPLSSLAWGLARLRTTALLPPVLLVFATAFPQELANPLARRWLRRMGGVLAVVGTTLALAPLAATQWPQSTFGELDRWGLLGIHIALCLPLLGWLVVRGLRTSGEEGRRARFFLTGLAIGLGPLGIDVSLQSFVPGYYQWLTTSSDSVYLRVTLVPLLASVPFTTAYAVLNHGVLDVRVLARRALQYLLARYTTLALTVAPFPFLGLYLVQERHRTLADLAGDSVVWFLLATAGLGGLGLALRQRIFDWIDRRYFRERYDARQLISQLVEEARLAASPRELAEQLSGGLERALQLESAALLALRPETGQLEDPAGFVAPLDPWSPLAARAHARSQPLDLEPRAGRTWLSRLPAADRQWITAHRAQVLVPLAASDGSLLGLVALGAKRSGFPFQEEEMRLLATVATPAALALEVRSLRRTPSGGDAAEAIPALECPVCGTLYVAPNPRCPACVEELVPASVPYVLPARLRFEQRLGSGGMGVVYRAVDLSLGRQVAVKTLRRLAADDAARLRREARHAAAASHPHLAAIHGVESWNGTPMLVLEYLAGGTLAARLGGGPLDPLETVELGLAMCQALACLHETGLLHRDVKPSNIGFDHAGTPKLMDFGIARGADDWAGEGSLPQVPGSAGGPLDATLIQEHQLITERVSRRLVGTLLYLPPEAFESGTADAGFDLWSLVLVLHECLSGRTAFGGEVTDVIRGIREAQVPEIRRLRPDCPLVLGDFFTRNLHLDRTRRAATARALGEELATVRLKLLA